MVCLAEPSIYYIFPNEHNSWFFPPIRPATQHCQYLSIHPEVHHHVAHQNNNNIPHFTWKGMVKGGVQTLQTWRLLALHITRFCRENDLKWQAEYKLILKLSNWAIGRGTKTINALGRMMVFTQRNAKSLGQFLGIKEITGNQTWLAGKIHHSLPPSCRRDWNLCLIWWFSG